MERQPVPRELPLLCVLLPQPNLKASTSNVQRSTTAIILLNEISISLRISLHPDGKGELGTAVTAPLKATGRVRQLRMSGDPVDTTGSPGAHGHPCNSSSVAYILSTVRCLHYLQNHDAASDDLDDANGHGHGQV
ncbi:hypothetical protein CVT26_000735 [Gymnopilus dilepis]|uniref:Uncharacterized protein n=1 Tax=Gymnopilus dilepis TaxID=231916 RepID=A0A409YU49_9AGAR|nr:hypothetical protein CVT26_000735 [Gymnopilus dilepis]